MDSYTFNEHRHNYAVWTAARAVQRNFTTTHNIKYAIEKCGLKEFAESEEIITGGEFNSLHEVWAEKLENAFIEKEINSCTYGRAAKIISIYLKTSVVLCNKGVCSRSSVIHPPIDGILLKNLSERKGLEDLRMVRWTQISKGKYWELVSRLREHFDRFDWTLEFYWTPERD